MSLASPLAIITGLIALAAVSCSAHAADDALKPRSWRPMVVTDLKLPGPATTVYAQLWADLIARNNEVSIRGGIQKRLVGNAPIREAHIVVRNATTVALLSILHAPILCQPFSGASQIRTCPLRLAIHRNGASTIREATGCFVDTDTAAGNGVFASYDTEARAIRLGTLLAHHAVEGCSKTVPIPETR